MRSVIKISTRAHSITPAVWRPKRKATNGQERSHYARYIYDYNPKLLQRNSCVDNHLVDGGNE